MVSWASAAIETLREGCLVFHELIPAHEPGVLDGAAAASFVLTDPGSSRREVLRAELTTLRPSRRVFVVENDGYRTCSKRLCQNASNYDIFDAYAGIMKFAIARWPDSPIALFEDDFFWAVDKPTSPPGQSIRDQLAEVVSFVASNAADLDHYSLGCVPTCTLSKWSNDGRHRRVRGLCGGAHAMLHTPSGMKAFMSELEADPCIGGLKHVENFFANHREAVYHEPLAYQMLVPGDTENSKTWPSWAKPLFPLARTVEPSFFSHPPEPAWHNVYWYQIEASGEAVQEGGARRRATARLATLERSRDLVPRDWRERLSPANAYGPLIPCIEEGVAAPRAAASQQTQQASSWQASSHQTSQQASLPTTQQALARAEPASQAAARFDGVHAKDVAAVGCLGDSMLTGMFTDIDFSQTNDLVGALAGNRPVHSLGSSYGCGDGSDDTAPEGVVTLATLLRRASPGLVGTSSGGAMYLSDEVGWALGNVVKGLTGDEKLNHFRCDLPEHATSCGFNTAVDGAGLDTIDGADGAGLDKKEPGNMLAQADTLIERIRAASPVEGWLVLTMEGGWAHEILFGALSDEDGKEDPSLRWRELWDGLLLRLREGLPGPTYVNIIGAMGPAFYPDYFAWRDQNSGCTLRDKGFANYPKDMAHAAPRMGARAVAYNQVLRDAAAASSDESRFVVRFQPLLANLTFAPELFENVMCTHPALPFSEAIARSLLQNMAAVPEQKLSDASALLRNGSAEVDEGSVTDLVFR